MNFVGTLKFHITELWDLDETFLLISILLSARNEMVFRLRGPFDPCRDILAVSYSHSTSHNITAWIQPGLPFPEKYENSVILQVTFLCRQSIPTAEAKLERQVAFYLQQWLWHCTTAVFKPPSWVIPHSTNLLGTCCHGEAKNWGLTLKARAEKEWAGREHRKEKSGKVMLLK